MNMQANRLDANDPVIYLHGVGQDSGPYDVAGRSRFWGGWNPALSTGSHLKEEAGTYLLAPVAKVVEVETPGETKPVEPYVGLEWRNEKSSFPRRKVLALFQSDGKEYAVIALPFGPECCSVEELQGRCDYPTTTTPPKREKRLVMLNGWTREGFASGSESGGTTDER